MLRVALLKLHAGATGHELEKMRPDLPRWSCAHKALHKPGFVKMMEVVLQSLVADGTWSTSLIPQRGSLRRRARTNRTRRVEAILVELWRHVEAQVARPSAAA